MALNNQDSIWRRNFKLQFVISLVYILRDKRELQTYIKFLQQEHKKSFDEQSWCP